MRLITILLLGLIAFQSQSQDWKTVTFDSKKKYKIISEDSLMNIWGDRKSDSEHKKVNADFRMSVKEQTFNLDFASAKLSGDTLKIWVFGYPGHYWFSHQIMILKNNYLTVLSFGDDDENESKTKTLNSKLFLNTVDFKKGKEIKGYLEYEGTCDNCSDAWRTIKTKGSFKVLIGD